VQLVQAVCPVIALKLPIGHCVQAVCPDSAANVPAGQVVQGSWPVALNCPGGQLAPQDARGAPATTATSAITCHHVLRGAHIMSLALPYHPSRLL